MWAQCVPLSAMWHLIIYPAYDPLASDAFLYLAQCNERKLLWSRKMQQDRSVEVSAPVYHFINLFLPVCAKLNIWHYLLTRQGKSVEHEEPIQGKTFWETGAGVWAFFTAGLSLFLEWHHLVEALVQQKYHCSQLFLTTFYSWEMRKRWKQTASCMLGRVRKMSENTSASRRNYRPVIWSNSFK